MNKFEESKKRWHEWRSQQLKETGQDPIKSLCNWEFEHKTKHPASGFKLECYLTQLDEKIEPVIFQFWPQGNGFTTYKPF